MSGPQTARSTLTWLVVSFVLTAFRCIAVCSVTSSIVCNAGIGVASTGHCHPKVVKAIQDQTQQFIIAQQNIFTASPAMVALVLWCCSLCIFSLLMVSCWQTPSCNHDTHSILALSNLQAIRCSTGGVAGQAWQDCAEGTRYSHLCQQWLRSGGECH